MGYLGVSGSIRSIEKGSSGCGFGSSGSGCGPVAGSSMHGSERSGSAESGQRVAFPDRILLHEAFQFCWFVPGIMSRS